MPWYLSFQILKLPQRLLGQRPGVAADTVAQLRERILQRGRGRALRGKARRKNCKPTLRCIRRS